MFKYAKICNEETKAVIVALGDDEEYYTSMGFELMDVEQDWKNRWFLKDYVPVQPTNEKKEQMYSELWRNYKDFQTRYVDAEDLTLATLCAQNGSAKGAAVQGWVMNLWKHYYEVKDLIKNAETLNELNNIDITTESLSTPLYTIRELNEEAATFLSDNNE